MAMSGHEVRLVTAARDGDSGSFEELFGIYRDKVYALARTILKNSGDAEDVLQETFIAAWKKLGALKTPEAFSVWIQIIAKNLCNMRLRKKNIAILLDADQEIENTSEESSEEALPAVYAEMTDLRERLGRIIESLPDVQRETVVLYYFSELSVEEISSVMECGENTVKTRLYLARRTIRSEIEEQERHSGEKFYGVAGIPMLPLGSLIRSHIQSFSLGESAARASLSAIARSISASGEAAKNSIIEGMNGKMKMSLSAKIITGISAFVAVAAVTVLIVVLSSGNTNGQEVLNPDASPTQQLTATPAITAELTESPALTSPQATPEPPAETNAPAEPESSYAYITKWSMRMDGQTDLAFDYVDWLMGKDAADKYIKDNPGTSEQDALEATEEMGYIRNTNPQERWFTTTKDTEYFMPESLSSVKPIKVSYDEFRNVMLPAIDDSDWAYTFVKVTVLGESIVKIEWVYLP